MNDRRTERTGQTRRGGLVLSPLTVLTAFAVLGLAAMVAIFVVSGFVLDERERRIAETFERLPDETTKEVSDIVPGEWTHLCVLNTAIKDPGKTRAPERQPGMLIPPMRHHANFLKSGYWIIATVDAEGGVEAEYRIDPDALANLAADNGGNFCARRGDIRFKLLACRQGCRRKIVFERDPH